MKFIDLFAGVGGLRRGLELAGHTCVGFCEWDKFATASYTSMHCITEEQRKFLATLDLNKRQKEILKEEYRNGEWYSNDICNVTGENIPRADCWTFGAPCQDFSIAGQRKGLDGDRSSLVREVFRILGEIRLEDRPEWLIYENVKGMLSSNRGWDFLAIILEMEQLGYDIEWQLLNSKDFGVPQNRERVYTVGHLRTRGECKVFPIGTTGKEDSIRKIDIIAHHQSYRRNTQVFSPTGITEALSTCQGGGREHFVAFGIDYNANGQESEIANCIKARYDAGVSNFRQDRTAVAVPIAMSKLTKKEMDKQYSDLGIENIPTNKTFAGKSIVHTPNGVCRTLIGCSQGSGSGNEPKVAIPVAVTDDNSKLAPEVIGGIGEKNFGRQWREGNRIYDGCKIATALKASSVGNAGGNSNLYSVVVPVLTPDRTEKRQNGRRFKDDGEPSFTLTAQDRHGVGLGFINPEDDGTCRTLKAQMAKNSVANFIRTDSLGATAVGMTISADNIVSETTASAGVNVTGNEVTGLTDASHCLNANDQRKVFGAKQERAMAAVLRTVRSDYGKAIRKEYEAGELDISRHEFTEKELRTDGISNTLDSVPKDNLLAVKVSNEPAPTKGIYVKLNESDTVYAVWYEKYQCYIAIRKLTPRECFRLQGWSDDFFEKAAFVNSDSQLYKQAGNGVTVSVALAVGEAINAAKQTTISAPAGTGKQKRLF